MDNRESETVENDEAIDKLNDPSDNKLLVDMEGTNRESRREKRANLWFDKDVFKGIEDDEDLEEADLETAIKAIKKKGGKIHQKVSDSNPNAPENKVHEKKKKPKQK